MITDRAYPVGAVQCRLETRRVKPVRPSDSIQWFRQVETATAKSRWVLIDVVIRNQVGERGATAEAMVEFPLS